MSRKPHTRTFAVELIQYDINDQPGVIGFTRCTACNLPSTVYGLKLPRNLDLDGCKTALYLPTNVALDVLIDRFVLEMEAWICSFFFDRPCQITIYRKEFNAKEEKKTLLASDWILV